MGMKAQAITTPVREEKLSQFKTTYKVLPSRSFAGHEEFLGWTPD
jgi:hypothetical protein